MNKFTSDKRNKLLTSLPNDLREIVIDVESKMYDAFNWVNIQKRSGEITEEQRRDFVALLLNTYAYGKH